MPNLSQSDADLIARTAVAEAAQYGLGGMAAVISSIKNRVDSGNFGKSVSQVIMAPHQYEPWGLPRRNSNHPLNVDPQSDDYKQAYQSAMDIFGGNAPSSVGDATHFYDPRAQSALGRQKPDWARGRQPVAQSGGHLFYLDPDHSVDPDQAMTRAITRGAPSGPSAQADPIGDAIDSAIAGGAPEGAKPTSGGFFSGSGLTMPAAQPAVSTAPSAGTGSLFKDAGLVPGGSAPSTPAASAPAGVTPLGIPMEGGLPSAAAWGPEPSHDIPSRFGSFLSSIQNPITAAYTAGGQAIKSGVADIRAQRPATGVGEILLSPATALGGATNALVAQPLTSLTGNPDFGERAAMVLPGVPMARGASLAADAVLPSSRAINELVSAVGPENIPEALNRLRANPRLSIADISAPVQSRTLGLQATPGSAQDILEAAKNERIGGAKGAVADAYDASLGPVPDVKALLDGLKLKARQTGQKLIQPALEKAQPVDVTSIINDIDKETGKFPGLPPTPYQHELLDLRDKLRGQWPDRDEMFSYPDQVHEIQSRLRQDAQTLLNSSTGSDRRLGGQMMDWRNRLVDAVDEASGGAYKPALKQYKDDLDIQDAFDKGRTIFNNAPANIENRPEFWRDWISKASPDEIAAAKTGARVQVDQLTRGTRFAARQGQNLPEVDFNVDRLNALFGKDETSQVIQKMADERAIAGFNQKLYQGSQTANKLLGAETMKPREVSPLLSPMSTLLPPALAEIASYAAGAPPGIAAPTMLGLGLARKGAQKVGQLSDIARNTEFARLATATGEARSPVINALEAAAQRSGLTYGQKLKNALSTLSLAAPMP